MLSGPDQQTGGSSMPFFSSYRFGLASFIRVEFFCPAVVLEREEKAKNSFLLYADHNVFFVVTSFFGLPNCFS